MKTRTLLLLSVATGLAIMLAAAVFLFQLSNQDDLVAPVEIGATTTVGDMSVTVLRADEVDGRLLVGVTLGGAGDDDPADEFRLIASGRPVALASSTCPPTGDTEPVTCEIAFDVSVADGSSRVLFYERGDQQSRWVLDQS